MHESLCVPYVGGIGALELFKMAIAERKAGCMKWQGDSGRGGVGNPAGLARVQPVRRAGNRRGRPRVLRPAVDRGTPELQRKHAAGATRDPLDICLERGLISADQHWCGVHLCWLHCLRFGVPQVQAMDFTEPRGRSLRAENPRWQKAREDEYRAVMQLLEQSEARQAVLDLCIYRLRPAFLDIQAGRPTAQRLANYADAVERIQEGLAILCLHWGRRGEPKANP